MGVWATQQGISWSLRRNYTNRRATRRSLEEAGENDVVLIVLGGC
jgi:hypothetical protein